MDDYKVPYTKILDITDHPNAERLSVATIYGFQVIIPKNKYRIGDSIIYIPVDSILPDKIEKILFPEDSKVKLHNSRVRQIRLRGLASSGMVVDPLEISKIVNSDFFELEQDLSKILNIVKYEPPQPGFSQALGKAKNRNKKSDHVNFHKYNGVENIKWFPDLFKEGEEVVIQEKLHGTNARAGVIPYEANTLMKRIKRLLRLAPKHENVYGSNNVDISAATSYKGFYGEDIYGKCLDSINVFEKIKLGEIFYGEIVGPGIQKNYEYGLKEHHFVVFDVKILQPDGKFKWLNPEEAEALAKERGFEFVPVLYRGPYNRELTYQLTKGPSVYWPAQKVREGVVIKARENYDQEGNKKALKWVSEVYLDDKNNSDFH